jgi:hypothetical protein
MQRFGPNIFRVFPPKKERSLNKCAVEIFPTGNFEMAAQREKVESIPPIVRGSQHGRYSIFRLQPKQKAQHAARPEKQSSSSGSVQMTTTNYIIHISRFDG